MFGAEPGRTWWHRPITLAAAGSLVVGVVIGGASQSLPAASTRPMASRSAAPPAVARATVTVTATIAAPVPTVTEIQTATMTVTVPADGPPPTDSAPATPATSPTDAPGHPSPGHPSPAHGSPSHPSPSHQAGAPATPKPTQPSPQPTGCDHGVPAQDRLGQSDCTRQHGQV